MKWTRNLVARTYSKIESEYSWKTSNIMSVQGPDGRPFILILDWILSRVIGLRRMKMTLQRINKNKKFNRFFQMIEQINQNYSKCFIKCVRGINRISKKLSTVLIFLVLQVVFLSSPIVDTFLILFNFLRSSVWSFSGGSSFDKSVYRIVRLIKLSLD